METLISGFMWDFMTLFLTAWLVAELVFFVAIRILAASANKRTAPAKYKSCPKELVVRILDNLDNLKTYDITAFFSGWFMGVSLDHVREENFQSFLAWVMYAKVFQDVNGDELVKLLSTATDIYERMSWTPKPGFNVNVQHVGMTVEDISYTHRPLLVYVLVYMKNFFTTIAFHFLGFQSRQLNDVHYWHREGQLNVDPVIFFHGITTGWGVYFGLIQAMTFNSPVFLFDFDAIKLFSLCFELPSPADYCTSVTEILDRHNAAKVNIVGHSFGTITASWFVDHFPERVSHLTLIDPVSLLLAHPEVAYNFLYRAPSSLIEWVIYYGASQEITIANCLRRNFWWYNNVLWLEDVPPSIGVHVSLAGADQVSRTSTIEEYVLSCKQSRRRNHREITAKALDGGGGIEQTSRDVAEINCSVREGHSHAQILVSRHALLELSFKVSQEYKRAVSS